MSDTNESVGPFKTPTEEAAELWQRWQDGHAPNPCDHCGGSGRLTIYDTATYIGQTCSPIGDEPCPHCHPDEDDHAPWCHQCGARRQNECTCGPIAENN